MQKNLFLMAAASALMLTACSSESDVVQNTTQTQQQTVVNRAVGFDVYTPSATNVTRAGLEGTMTTNRMQRSEADGGGFGVYAFLTEDNDPDAGTSESAAEALAYARGNGTDENVPNFMVNEKVLWNNTNLGWYYNPLKYWPNETDKDSQTTPASMEGTTPVHLDRLTFFAYAPYVSGDDGLGTGITYITDKNGHLNTSGKPTDPTIAWNATTNADEFNPNEGVDLLWGVAPAGGLSYTAVNGWTVTRNEGTPLLNMIKPDVNTSMKFLFQHALARIGVNVVAAIDQVSPGGELDPNTKITINSFKITGPFGTTGELNLNNDGHPSVANWTKVNSTPVASGTKIISPLSEITVVANEGTNAIAENLRWTADGTSPHTDPVAQPVVGVTTAKQDLLIPSNKWFNKKAGASTPYDPGKKYFSNEAGTAVAHAKYTTDGSENLYTESTGVYTKVAASTDITAPDYPGIAITPNYYILSETSTVAASTTAAPSTAQYYTKAGNVYTPTSTWPSTETYYTLEIREAQLSDFKGDMAFKYSGDIYEAERNYLYVVPTNNFNAVQASPLSDNEAKALRTITVQIEYFITTKDDKLFKSFAETKNVITKTVVLPSLSNGKTYMLNVVLGLTSVKIEAEVDDWKVVNSQADLPQNTAE